MLLNNINNRGTVVGLRIHASYFTGAIVSDLLNANLIYMAKIRKLRVLMETDLPLSKRSSKRLIFFHFK